MPDYSKSIIYTIRSRDSVYVGSTIDFRSRKNQHKGCIYNENSAKYNVKLYKTIRGNNHEWDMQPYSQYPCNSKMELSIEEERVRQLLKADMNTISCGTGCSTQKERCKQYYEQHKDYLNEKNKQYNEEHKDELKQYQKQYYEQNKDKIGEQMKQYNDKNKDKKREYDKQYREQRKDELREKRKQKVTCECGCIVTRYDLAQHRRSKKHINLMEKLNQ